MQTQTDIARSIITHLMGLVADSENTPALDVTSDLIESGILDSLNIVRLIQFVETEFSCQIDDEDIESELFASATHLAEYVMKHRKN